MKLVSISYTSDMDKGTPSGYGSRSVPDAEAEATAKIFMEQVSQQYPGKVADWKKTGQNTWESTAQGKEKPIGGVCKIED